MHVVVVLMAFVVMVMVVVIVVVINVLVMLWRSMPVRLALKAQHQARIHNTPFHGQHGCSRPENRRELVRGQTYDEVARAADVVGFTSRREAMSRRSLKR